MIDIKLKPVNQGIGLDLSNGIAITDDLHGIAQRLMIKLRTLHREWFYDSSIGIPYQRVVLVHNPNLQEIENVFRQNILNTPEVVDIISFVIDFNPTTRKLYIDFNAKVKIMGGEDLINISLNI